MIVLNTKNFDELQEESLKELKEKGEVLFPVLFYPFDFISMQPVDGTRHRLLR